jgi:hypothetical protein
MPITICHLPIIYGGKYEHSQSYVPTFINNLKNNEPIVINNTVSHCGYDTYLYMDDLINAYHKIIKIGYNTKQYELFNMSLNQSPVDIAIKFIYFYKPSINPYSIIDVTNYTPFPLPNLHNLVLENWNPCIIDKYIPELFKNN